MSLRLDSVTWARKLKIRHLEVLLVLCDARGITAAARELHLTQPAVSHWLSDLEEIVGQPLFVRGRQLTLTPIGEVFRHHAERMLGDVFRVDSELASVRSGLSGRIQVGSIISAAPSLLPRAITEVQSQFPRLRVSVAEATFETLLERLRKREIDIAIGPLDLRAHKSGFASELLIEDTVAVVVSPGHALARKRKPSWKEVAALPWIMPPVGTLMRARLESAFQQAGVPVPEPLIETGSLVMIQMLLGHSDFISVLAGSVAQIYCRLKLMNAVNVSPSVGFGDIGMLWDPAALDSKLLAFSDALRRVAQSLRSE
jgi:DNA-binding transcriptional LysR family regulator